MGPISDTGIGGSGSSERVKVLGCKWRSAGGGVMSLVVWQSGPVVTAAATRALARGGELWDMQCSLW